MHLLAKADLDLRGDTDLAPEMVMEVLVARLSRLGSRRYATRRAAHLVTSEEQDS